MSRAVLRECSADETRAMILHEYAHVEARDNDAPAAARLPDLFARAAQLDRAWEAASEEAADAAVARQAPQLALVARAGARFASGGWCRDPLRRLGERPLLRRQHRSAGPAAGRPAVA